MKVCRVCMLLTVLLLLFCGTCEAYAADTIQLGDQITDFTFTTYDGQSYTLSEVMRDKEAVMINIWATWCGPCNAEFPFMQQAYEKYQDRVEIIALSCETNDTDDVLAAYAKSNGLTFKIGKDPVGFLQAIGTSSIPSTMMIDRYGTVCFIESGAQTSAGAFERLFEAFLGDEYTESVLLRGIPAAKPNVEKSAEAALTAAVEAAAVNPTSASVWPMVVTEKDGCTVVMSTNAKQSSTEASISATINANAGDAIVVTFKTSTESIFDVMQIRVNGKVVKKFTGEHDWMDYAIPVETDGEYTIKISYVKDSQGDAGEDTIWVDRIALAENAQQALNANVVYAVAEEVSLRVLNPEAREIIFEDPTGLLRSNFGEAKYYITNVDTAEILGTLTDAYDPETGFFYTSGGELHHLAKCMSDDGYSIQVNVDSINTTGYICSSVYLYPENTGVEYSGLILFRDEEHVKTLVEYNALGEWHYVDEQTADLDLTATLPSQVNYVLKCVDQNGDPVAGVMMQVCDDTICQVYVSDAEGRCEFEAVPKAWEVHVLMAPEGYAAESNEVVLAPVEGGELVFTFNKQ